MHAASLHKIGRLFENEALLQVRPCMRRPHRHCTVPLRLPAFRRLARADGVAAATAAPESSPSLFCLSHRVLWYGVQHHPVSLRPRLLHVQR